MAQHADRRIPELLISGLPPVTADGHVGERPTLLPLPGELPANEEIKLRLARIARLAVPSATRLSNQREDPDKQKADSLATEARLFFAYLLDDFPAADFRPRRSGASDYIARRPALTAQLACSDPLVARPAGTGPGDHRLSGRGARDWYEARRGNAGWIDGEGGSQLRSRSGVVISLHVPRKGLRPNRIHDSICSMKSTTFPSITRSPHPNRSRSTIGPATLRLLPSSATGKRCRT